MSDEEYQVAQQALIMAARLLAQHDWTAFFDRIATAENVGMFLMAPFEYQRAVGLTRHIGSMSVDAKRLVRHLGELDAAAAVKP